VGISKGNMMVKILSVGAGFLAGDMINTQIDKLLPKTTDPVPVPTKNAQTAAAVGEIGLGGLLLLRKQSRGTMGAVMTYGGGILMGAGLKRALKVMGVISGFQSVPVIGRHRMAGYQSVPVIGQSVIPAQLAGRTTPPQLAGYVPAGSGVGAYVPAGSGVGVMGSIGACYECGSGITSDNSSGYMN